MRQKSTASRAAVMKTRRPPQDLANAPTWTRAPRTTVCSFAAVGLQVSHSAAPSRPQTSAAVTPGRTSPKERLSGADVDSNIKRHCAELASQVRTLRSRLAERTVLPPSEKQTAETASVWPSNVRSTK